MVTDIIDMKNLLDSVNTKVSRGRMSVEFMLWKIGPKLDFLRRKHFCLVCETVNEAC